MLKGAWIAGLVIVACAAILLTDFAGAARRAPRDDRLIKSLEQQVKTDASLAPKLETEQKRITAARLGRKSRDNAIAWVLIAASAVFLTCAKRLVGAPPRPAPPQKATSLTSVPGRRPATIVCPTIDLAFVDQIVAREGRGRESAIPLLQAIQAHYRYLPDEALRRLCELTEITPAQLAGTSSFYKHFRRSPVGRHVVRVCHGTACHVAGARQITDELRRYLAIAEGADTDPQRQFTLDEVACLGCCSLAPVLMVDGHTAGRLTPTGACGALAPFETKEPA